MTGKMSTSDSKERSTKGTYGMEMIEVYLILIMKIREFKDMIVEDPGDEDLPEGLRTFKNLQRIIMVRGPEGRKMVIDHLRCVRQYIFHFHVRRGDEPMDLSLGESEYADGWAAAHYGPPLPPDENEDTRSQQEGESDEDDVMSPADEEERAVPGREELDEPEPES
ncbi:unnamed protein product, partial [Durusdinium trenchii]